MASKPLQTQSEESELRIVLLGKTGVGKSASGNKILGREMFKTDLSSAPVTENCMRMTREFAGQTLAIVDTPGLLNRNKEHKEVMNDILDCIMLTSPGPHVFLLVLRLDVFRAEEKTALEAFQNIFPGAKRHTIVLFTRGDPREVDAFIEKHTAVKNFIDLSCEAYHVFDSNVKDESQVTGLLQKINNMVQKNERSYYSNEMIDKAASALEEEMQRPEVKSASDPKEAGKKSLGSWISKGLDTMLEEAPVVKAFLEKLKEAAIYCMPPEARQSE